VVAPKDVFAFVNVCIYFIMKENAMNWAYYMVLIVAFWIILDLDIHEFNMDGPNQLYYISAW
jgi:hypothetical protein